MSLDTNTDVDEIKGVKRPDGTRDSAANLSEQEATNDRLGNHAALESFEYATSGTAAEAITSHAVPEGVSVLVSYAPGNSDTVFVGDSGTQAVPLTGLGMGVSLAVEDTDAIYIQTPTAGDGVTVLFEVDA